MVNRNKAYPYVLITPAILFLMVVTLYPTLYSLYLAMTRTRMGVMEFIGLKNFQIALNSSEFWQSMRNTLIFTSFYVILTVVIGYGIALLLNRKLRLTALYMTIIFLPWVLSEITSGVVWRWMFYQDFGILQNLLGPLFGGYKFIARPAGAMGIVIAATVWRSISFAMLLLLAGLQTVPREVHEAASIDGADAWDSFWKITWPLTLPTTMVTIVFMTIQAVNGVGMILSITEGGPGRATEVLGLLMYRQAMQFYNFGYAAAISVTLLILNLILAAFYLRGLSRENALSG